MPNTYDPIATYTFSSAASTYTFSSIPGTYTDLIVMCYVKAAVNPSYGIALQFNSDTGTNYDFNYMYGTGSGAFASSKSSQSSMSIGYGTGVGSGSPSVLKAHILDYANTTTYKSVFTEGANYDTSYGGVENLVGNWRSTAAINSITVYAPYGSMTLAIGSTLTLYGIKAA